MSRAPRNKPRAATLIGVGSILELESMLSFEEIEDCFPEGAESDMPRSGRTLVSAQWLHDFAHAIAAKEREAAAKRCEALAGSKWVSIEAAGECADAVRSNVEVTGCASRSPG